jgi:hypothetical protein
VFQPRLKTYGELAAHIGALVIQDLKTTAGALLKAPGAWPAYVAIDEFSALDGDHLLALIARARSADIRVLLCTQELADLDRAGDGLRDQVLGNTATKLAHRQDVPASAETLAAIAGTYQTWRQTHQIQRHLLLGSARTGVAAERLTDEFRLHPNTLKHLLTGDAALITKHPAPSTRVVRVLAMGGLENTIGGGTQPSDTGVGVGRQ